MARKSTKKAEVAEEVKVEEAIAEETPVQNVPEAEKAVEEVKADDSRNDSKDKEIELLKEQNAVMMEQMRQLQEMLANAQRPQVIQVAADVEKVHLLWQAEVADDNVVMFGEGGRYGRVVGKRGEFYMTKTDFSTIIDDRMRYFLDNRWLIVLDGLTEDEREVYGVDYKEGELIDKKAFGKLLDFGAEMKNIYPKLCEGHKRMIAQRYIEAWRNGDGRVDRATVVALNEMSKSEKNRKGDFVSIIEEMNAKDASEDN